MALLNAAFGWAILGLVWLRPHPDALPAALAVYVGDVLLFAVVLVAIVANLPRIGARSVSIAPAVLAGVLALYPTVAVVLSGFDPERTKGLLITAYLFLVSLALLVLVDGVPMFRRLIRWKVQRIAVWTVLGVALVQLFMGNAVEPAVHALWGSTRLRGLGFAAPRIYGTFYNANWFGIVMAIVLVHAIWLSLMRRSGWTNYVTIAGATGGLIASGSRSALIAGVLGVAGCALALAWKLRVRTVVHTIFAVTVLGGSLFVLFAVNDTFAGSSRYTEIIAAVSSGDFTGIGSAQERVEAWRLYASAVADRPFLGPGEVSLQTTAHNSYLSAAALFGVPGGGALILLLLFVSAYVAGLHTHRRFYRYGTYMVVFAAGAATAEYWFTTQVYLALVMILLAFAAESGGKVDSVGIRTRRVNE